MQNTNTHVRVWALLPDLPRTSIIDTVRTLTSPKFEFFLTGHPLMARGKVLAPVKLTVAAIRGIPGGMEARLCKRAQA